jgi:hypothetical protein
MLTLTSEPIAIALSEKKTAARKMQVPADWHPDAGGVAYAKARNLSPADLVAFIDFHRSKGNLFLDTDAAWRTWCRNAVKYGAVPPSLPRPSSTRGVSV